MRSRRYFGLLSVVLALELLQSPWTIAAAAQIDTQHSSMAEPSHESRTTEVVPQHQRRNMAGGYADANISEERVVDAAQFAVSALAQKQLEEEDEEGGDGERTTYTFNAIRADEVNLVVLEAQKQVVAGMNYRLTIGVTDRASGECLGGFKCIVYDRFGDLSLSIWGKEVECGEVGLAIARLKDEEGDEEG